MRASTIFFNAVLLALATASPRSANSNLGIPVVSRAEPGSLVTRADGLSPEIAQYVSDNGITPGCFSSTTAPELPAKLRKRQNPEMCPAPGTSTCKAGFTALCCDEQGVTVGTRQAGFLLSGCVALTVSTFRDCPASNLQCCLRWISNPLRALNPDEYKGWGMYCYNPSNLFG
ncbi:hypothetical protein MMC29_001717 [Sticta canariensis]|nr:hypothetical protein [Sticta canariensis]